MTKDPVLSLHKLTAAIIKLRDTKLKIARIDPKRPQDIDFDELIPDDQTKGLILPAILDKLNEEIAKLELQLNNQFYVKTDIKDDGSSESSQTRTSSRIDQKVSNDSNSDQNPPEVNNDSDTEHRAVHQVRTEDTPGEGNEGSAPESSESTSLES